VHGPHDPWATLEERDKRDYIFKLLESKEELVDWVLTYFDIDLTTEITDSNSTSNPASAMWEVYCAVRDNTGGDIPGYILLSSRDSYKTLSASILEFLLLLHFQVTIAHMAAIKSQSSKAISYISVFINKVKKYIEHHGWKNISNSQSMIQFRTPLGDEPYIRVIICTMAGANSEHTDLMFIDEIDVVQNPLAYDEAKMIPTGGKGRYPITVKLSTRKFAFGLMQRELDLAKEAGEKILQWNILDVTERCPSDRYNPSGAKKPKRVRRFIAKELPLRQISPEEYEGVAEANKSDWEEAQAYEGCLKCPLFAVCKGELAKKSPKAVGGLYKPIKRVINDFKKLNPDMAQAQLLCRKPSTKGLIYGRFEPNLLLPLDRRNVITLDEAYEQLMGKPHKNKVTIDDIIEAIKQLGVVAYTGLDWGYTKEFAIVVGVVLDNGDFWILETFGEPELELSDQLEKALEIDARWDIKHWFVDRAYPGSIKTFEGQGLKCPDFKKDVMGGIEAIRGQIVDSVNRRRLKVLYWEKNGKVLQMFKVHHFKLDAIGNVTEDPDDDELSDVGDALRYMGQNLFGKRKGKKPLITSTAESPSEGPRNPMDDALRLRDEIRRRAGLAREDVKAQQPKSNAKRRKIFWNI
jgi:hypothetical protein